MMQSGAAVEIPAHVPAELVRPCPLLRRGYTLENPFKSMVAEIHRGPEIFYSVDAYPGGRPAWVLRRYEDLRAVYLDTENFSNNGLTPFSALIGESWVEIPVELDPPLHSSFRALLNPLFSPKKMAALDDSIRNSARRFISNFRDRGECEFMADFAFPFPVTVFLDLIGLPQEDMPKFLKWEHSLLHETDMSRVADAVRATKAYLLQVIADRRANPGTDFISYGVHAEVEGRELTEDELIGYCFNLFVGGLDTISTSVGLLFRHLAEVPEHQQRLRTEPSFIPIAMEELLRAYAPTSTFRTCVREVQIRGATLKPGDKLAMPTTLACRDPAAFERPEEVILDRKATHVTFAYGPHNCIGAPLARREIRIALEEFLAAIPEFSITTGARIETSLGGVIQPRALPLVW